MTKPWSHLHPQGQSYLPLQDDQILYADQPVALVVATTRDQAAYAGTLIGIKYESSPPAVFDRPAAKEAVQPPQFLWPVASSVGNAEKAIADSPVKIEQTYATADRHHNQMEPHATTAVWDADGALTLYETTQHIFGTRELVSIVLGVPQEKVNVVCQFLGGGFGGKAYVWPHTLIAAAAAKVLNRPVHVQLTRAQMYSNSFPTKFGIKPFASCRGDTCSAGYLCFKRRQAEKRKNDERENHQEVFY